MSDLGLLILDTAYNSYKNNNIYTGSETISGTTSPGVNSQTFTIALNASPDLVDLVFTGPANSTYDPRPTGGWFKQNGSFFVNISYSGGYPSQWFISSAISGSNLILTAYYTQTFTGTYTITNTAFSYRLIDYSVF